MIANFRGDLKNVTDEELQKIIKDAEAEMEMQKYDRNRTKRKNE